MARKPDPFWEYTEDRKKCNYCDQIYTSGTSVWRVKHHLSGIPGGGIKRCQKVPDDVKEKARATIAEARARADIDGPPGKKPKPPASSSNNQADNITIPASLPGQNSEAENGIIARPVTSPGDHTSEISLGGPLAYVQDNVDVLHELYLQSPVNERHGNQNSSPSVSNDVSRNDEGVEPEQTVVGDEGLQHSIGDEGNMGREPKQTIVRNRGEIEHHVEGTTYGDLMVNPALRTAHVSQDCEATLAIPDLFTEDNFVSSNMECTSMGLMQHPEGGGVLEKFTVDKDGQPTDLQCQVNERPGNQICSPSVSNDVSRNDEWNMTREPEQTVLGDGYHEGLQHTTGDEERDVFPTPKLQGRAFEENQKVIWSWLMNNEVSLIGIYGMGGVGKTTLMEHIHNRLLDKPDRYRHVHWITVSQDFSIYKLQNLIATCIGLDLSNEHEKVRRAAKLSEALAGRQNYVLILDDLWNYFDPDEVGIPSKMDGCKLILTTRSLDLCRQMRCEGNAIKVQPLLKEEAWNLFKMELGNYDIKLEHLAKSVADECDGLPLGIRTMARSMRGVYDEREWRNALEELKEARVRVRDMEPEVFRILRYSFLHLNDSKLQQSFLYCALFPEDFEIKREELIEFFISERMIEGRKSREAEFDKGHEMLNQLVNACLLESATTGPGLSAVKMHDLVRDMALQQLRENSHVMVEAGEQLEELPDEEKWSQDLVRVSLMENYIMEIPSSRSPSCPNLSTLLLNRNQNLKFIGDSFFKQMQRLEVLDLSKTAIQELPDSISDLVTLTALLLGGCQNLKQVPSLGKLRVLRKLDLRDTAIRKLPRGLKLLSSLRYLDLSWSEIREFPVGILPKLCHLQVFKFCQMNPRSGRPVIVKLEELARLRNLETLEYIFHDLLAFKKYLKDLDHRKKGTQPPSIFKFVIGQELDTRRYPVLFRGDLNREICLHRQEIKGHGDVWVLPKGIQELVMDECSDLKNLCDFYPSHHETELKSLSIVRCHSMECLVSCSQMSLNMLGTIERLKLNTLYNLSFICRKARAAPTPLLPGDGIFSHLKELQITGCPKLETLFPSGLLPNLGNLEKIEVVECLNLEKIISEEESNISSSDLAIEFSLPKLQYLEFVGLPALTSFGCGKLVCNSLQRIRIRSCERLKSENGGEYGRLSSSVESGNSILSHLKELQIVGCPKLETLFPSGLLPNLGNLEKIEVVECLNLEKIISEEESNISSSDLAIEFSLPKLQSLEFVGLPALTSFGCGKLVCNSLQRIKIWGCERLKRLPFSCSPRNAKVFEVQPKIWWESVEWDLKNDYVVQCEKPYYMSKFSEV